MEPIIEVRDLSIGYGERTVIANADLKIYPGELLGIVGCNGAGKSTLLKTIRGILPRQGGSISYYNKPMEELTEKEFARTVAYLQQAVEVGFNYTAKEIVMAGRYPYMEWWQNESPEDEALAMECLEYTGTRELADKSVTEVSGGQKQRVLLAKVLAQQTPILFLDEPTTGLDMVYQEEIFRFAHELAAQGKTIVMVVHELNLAAKYCSQIALLGEGSILAVGKPEEVFTDELLSRAYHAKIKVEKNPVSGWWEFRTLDNNKDRTKELQLLNKICNPIT